MRGNGVKEKKKVLDSGSSGCPKSKRSLRERRKNAKFDQKRKPRSRRLRSGESKKGDWKNALIVEG